MTGLHLLDKLPLEILMVIVKELRLKDVSALSRCNRHSYDTLSAALYSLDAKQPDRWALHWAATNGILATASKSLAAGSPPNQYCDTRLATADGQDVVGDMKFGGPAANPIEIAIRHNHKDMVALLLSHGSEVSTHPATWLYGLDQAIENGRSDWVNLYDAALRVHLTRYRSGIEKCVIKAMKHDHKQIFDHLLALVPPWAQSYTRALAFKAAACAGLLSWLKDLYELGFMADLSQEATGCLWFEVATSSRREHGTLAFDFLAEQWPWLEGFRIDEPSRRCERSSYFHSVCKNGNLPMAKRLLGLGACPRRQWSTVWPLMAAIEAEDYEMAEFLLFNGAELDLNQYHETKRDAILEACQYGSVDIVELLIRRGANVATPSDAYLLSAIEGGHLPMIQYWLSRGHKVPAHALHLLFVGILESRKAWLAAPEAVRLLVEAGASVDIRSDKGLTPFAYIVKMFFYAEKWRDEAERDVRLEIAKVLVFYGADCREIFQNESTRSGICHSSKGFLQFLLDQPCIVDISAEAWFEVLNDAGRGSDEDWFSTLLEYMMQHNMWTDYTRNMNHLTSTVCCSWNNKERGSRCRILSKILQPNAEGSRCMVNLCSWTSDAESLRLLLASRIDYNFSGSDGLTPLHAASRRGQASLVRLLLEAGADVAAKDVTGATPMDLALTRSKHDCSSYGGVFELLLMYGSPLGKDPITDAEIDARPGFRQVLDKYVSKTELDKWLTVR